MKISLKPGQLTIILCIGVSFQDKNCSTVSEMEVDDKVAKELTSRYKRLTCTTILWRKYFLPL